MTTSTQTLADWLLEQIVDDEASVVHGDCRCERADARRPDCPDRVLAECASKRAIVEHLSAQAAKCPEDDWPEDGNMAWAPLADNARCLLRALAQPYADRDGFRPEWR